MSEIKACFTFWFDAFDIKSSNSVTNNSFLQPLLYFVKLWWKTPNREKTTDFQIYDEIIRRHWQMWRRRLSAVYLRLARISQEIYIVKIELWQNSSVCWWYKLDNHQIEMRGETPTIKMPYQYQRVLYKLIVIILKLKVWPYIL